MASPPRRGVIGSSSAFNLFSTVLTCVSGFELLGKIVLDSFCRSKREGVKVHTSEKSSIPDFIT